MARIEHKQFHGHQKNDQHHLAFELEQPLFVALMTTHSSIQGSVIGEWIVSKDPDLQLVTNLLTIYGSVSSSFKMPNTFAHNIFFAHHSAIFVHFLLRSSMIII